ncbi:ferrochelatase [uncultured Gemella sp.]|uniref:ferrochelatase n=1 Tax=uncultured Gemella sp. TaxID=254352 RepID=UPI0028E9CA5E|nr:ferrochelatase [uncultured Gemella sp.]
MKKAILVMTYGTPEEYTFEGVAKFFTNIRRGVRPNDEEINHLLKNYLRIEGSPLQEITLKEVELLKEAVRDKYQVYFANKFSSPYIPDVISKMEEDNIEECICLILEPHYSFYSIMGYERFIKSDKIKFNIIKSWYKEEKLIEFWADEIKKIIDTEVKNDSFKVIFSAHSVPEIALKYNDPYVDQIFDMTKLIAEKIGLDKDNYTNTWQSESDIGMPWIKPDVLEYLRDQKEHPKHYIFVPLSFISEHIEVLFDNDVECRELCEEFGVAYHRPPMPNYDSRLIEALVSAVNGNKDNPFIYHNPEQTTFNEMDKEKAEMPDFVKKMLANKKDGEKPEMPDFVKKMLANKKDGEKPEMPDFVKKMLANKETSRKAKILNFVKSIFSKK